MTPRERWTAITVFLVTVIAVASPLLHGRDDFPLSTYPMFSWARGRVSQVPHVVGFSSEGNHRPLPPPTLGTDEVLQAYRIAENAIDRGAAASQDLCRRVAERAATDDDLEDIERIEVRVDWYDNVAYWKGERAPTRSHITARCPVQRS